MLIQSKKFLTENKSNMKIFHIGDTHGYHGLLDIPQGIDMIIHSGDFSNSRDVYQNEQETRDFIEWFKSLEIRYKILISGNHDAMAFKWSKEFKQLCKDSWIIYLEHESTIVEGINIFGSPYTPVFGNWYFTKKRGKLDRVWESVPDNTDILVTHGPPMGVLDLTYRSTSNLEFCGCRALKRHVLDIIKPDLHLFGHIHNTDDIINAGTMKLSRSDTIFSNGSVVTDNKFGKLTSQGNIIEYKKIK